jgi:hypothetical protein
VQVDNLTSNYYDLGSGYALSENITNYVIPDTIWESRSGLRDNINALLQQSLINIDTIPTGWTVEGKQITKTAKAQSILHGGSVTSPAAVDTVIIVSASLAPGTYDVELSWYITGTAETLPTNLKVVGGVSSGVTLPTLPGSYKVTFTATFTSTNNIYLRTNAAATTGAIYSAIIRTTKIA